MDAKQTRRRFPDLQFRVLVIGRANAGKTSILQRVCETTESPTIYRGNEEVRGPTFCLQVGSHRRQVTLNPSMNVSASGTFPRFPLIT
jgi:septin family protein